MHTSAPDASAIIETFPALFSRMQAQPVAEVKPSVRLNMLSKIAMHVGAENAGLFAGIVGLNRH